MSITIDALDADVVRIASIHVRGVDLRPWPRLEGQEDGGSLAPPTPSRPILYLVSGDAAPPHCGVFEDWARTPCPDAELEDRVQRLMLRSQAHAAAHAIVDEDGVLRIGERLVLLSQQEACMLRLLLAHRGEVVPREDLHHAIWGSEQPDDPRALDNRVKALRERLAGLPIEVHTVRGRGMLLDVAVPAGGTVSGRAPASR